MVEMKNPVKEANANPGINHLSMWRTDLAYFWVINCEGRLQDDMHYHDNDDHIFMLLEGECTIRTPHKEFVLKQFDTVLLQSGEAYQLCNTGTGECCCSAPATRGSTASREPACRRFPVTYRSQIRLLRDGAKIYALTR